MLRYTLHVLSLKTVTVIYIYVLQVCACLNGPALPQTVRGQAVSGLMQNSLTSTSGVGIVLL